jgi:hypothetical protein
MAIDGEGTDELLRQGSTIVPTKPGEGTPGGGWSRDKPDTQDRQQHGAGRVSLERIVTQRVRGFSVWPAGVPGGRPDSRPR